MLRNRAWVSALGATFESNEVVVRRPNRAKVVIENDCWFCRRYPCCCACGDYCCHRCRTVYRRYGTY